jgi:hypothetical protein
MDAFLTPADLLRDLGVDQRRIWTHHEDRNHMITLQQDADGFIRMNRHFPDNSSISITFADGSSEVFTGQQINATYDEALVVYRAQNHLDVKGFSRGPAKTVHHRTKIEFVPVHAGMAK